MYAFLIIIHVIVSIFLIAVILLQAGRGTGLADTFGGAQMQSMFGTKSATILTKLTTVCAVIFIITCLSLAIFSSRTSRSLIEEVKMPEPAPAVDIKTGEAQEQGPSLPAAPVAEEVQGDSTQGSANEAE